MTNLDKPLTIRIKKARKELLGTYANAAGCLYGALSLTEFVGVFNHYENEKTNEQEAELALQRYAKMEPEMVEYSLYKNFITGPNIQPDFFEDDVEYLHYIRMHQKGKPRYMPSKEEFLKYSDGMYREPEHPYADLKAYILRNNLRNTEGLDGVDGDLLDLHEMIQNGIEPQNLIQYFLDRGYPLRGINKINAFLQVVTKVQNNTRLFENNGFTPEELMKIQVSKRPEGIIMHQPKKVGRNDPCPCGSGKKFKKCCDIVETSGSAQLPQSERKLFYETWYKLLDYVNRELKVVDYKFNLSNNGLQDETLLYKIRERLWEQPKLISKFISEAVFLSNEEIQLLQSWEKKHIKGMFVLLKYNPDSAILMRMDQGKASRLYAVKGINSSIAEAMHRKLPVMLETILLPFADKIVYDSYMAAHAIDFGGGITAMFEEEFAIAETKYGILTKL